jgi:DNA polymerase III subunit chi
MFSMPEVLFYHLEQHPLERVLPTLLEKTLDRQWRAIVRPGSLERLEALDMHLWTYRDDSFLPHGTAREGAADHQPIVLTLDTENPNGAEVLFLVDGAEFTTDDQYPRIVYLFDGRDEEALACARVGWKRARDAGHDVTYWQQEASGRWVKRA